MRKNKIRDTRAIKRKEKSRYLGFKLPLCVLLIIKMNFSNIKIVLVKIYPSKLTTKESLKIFAWRILAKTDDENIIPPMKAITIDAKIPRMVMYSFC